MSVRHPASEISGEISPEEIGRRITGAIGAGKSGEEGRLIRRQVPEVAAAAGGQFDSMLISVKPKRTFPPLLIEIFQKTTKTWITFERLEISA